MSETPNAKQDDLAADIKKAERAASRQGIIAAVAAAVVAAFAMFLIGFMLSLGNAASGNPDILGAAGFTGFLVFVSAIITWEFLNAREKVLLLRIKQQLQQP